MNASEGLGNLVQNTVRVVDVTLNSGQSRNQRHIEYLAYPDNHFLDEFDSNNLNRNRTINDIYSGLNKTFLDNQSIQVIHIGAERIYNPVTEFLYPYLYRIQLQHGSNYRWTIEKRYKHFHDLHKSLLEFVESETGRSISSLNKSYLSEIPQDSDENQEFIGKNRMQPCFPTQNDRLASMHHFSIEDRCKMFEEYLNLTLKHPKFREHLAMREFLEVSPLSFVNELGQSLRESPIGKRSNDDFRGRSIFLRAPFICDKFKFHHGQKWFVLKDSYLVYLKPNSTSIGFPMLFDRGFSLNQGFRKTGTNNGIQIKNLQRMMIIKFEKEEERNQWFNLLMETKSKSLFTINHPFNSFAPKREKQYAQWFLNGQSYMEAVAKAIQAAKEEIFITDWWLSPEIMLIRPSNDSSMRLDNLLGKRAEEGIRVYVMVFKDIVQVVGLNSWHTKVELMKKSPTKKNIRVIRHPDHRILPGSESSFLYSHHEKTLIIDQKIAFIGGIDLCWGRWDTNEHRLIDIGDENITDLKLPEQSIDPSMNIDNENPKIDEHSLETIRTMTNNHDQSNNNSTVDDNKKIQQENHLLKSNFAKNLITTISKKRSTSQLSLNDQSGTENNGVTTIDKELNSFEKEILANEDQIEIKTHKYGKKWKRLLKKEKHLSNDDSSSDDEEIFNKNTDEQNKDEANRTTDEINSVFNPKSRFFLGKDYSNSYEKDFEFIEKFDEDYIDRQRSPRMPWHDQALIVIGQSARDCARHFIQRWNIHKADKYRFNDFYPYLLPKSSEKMDLSDLSVFQTIIGDNRPIIEVDAQCVRSTSFWSCGTRIIEHSIQDAYLHLIDSAQHFIYIENQFFISIADDRTIKNGIADALFRRIMRANINKEKFRVYVVLPLLPGFSNANAVQAVLYFIMRSINQGEKSLYQRLKKNGVLNPEDYITFYGMRNWDILMGELITEIVYVHSKLMIVDDRMCICGSANINDRSLQGSRDSEFCLVVNDRQMVDSQLNGKLEKVGLFCSTWRKTIFRQILGIKNNEINIDDPTTDEFYQYFRETARTNGMIYEQVFNTIPTNEIRKFADVASYVERPKLKTLDPYLAHEKCKQIRGFIVDFPLEFAADDSLMPKWNTSEGMAPILLWT